MSNQDVGLQPSDGLFSRLKQLVASIGTKIILPYLLLTLAVAGIGAFIVTNLVTGTLQERFNNQLLDAGRITSEAMVRYEMKRLETLRAVAGTEGVAEALIANDTQALDGLIPQIAINSAVDAVELLDINGQEVYGWQRPPGQTVPFGETRSGASYAEVEEVQRVLSGFVDDFGEKRVLFSNTPYGKMIFTIGPVYQDDTLVGAVLVGTYIREMLVDLTETAVARITLYDQNGNVIDSTLSSGQEGLSEIIQEPPSRYRMVLNLLQNAPEQFPVVANTAENEVPLREAQVLGQDYTLAFGNWRIRDQSFGLFSVALPSNFIVSTAAKSRTTLSLLFSVATVAVFAIGFFIAQRIIQPLNQLVRTSLAVSQGDLEQRTSIKRNDEIGALAHSFDVMTENLQDRNRQLVEQASELKTILNSIADGVLVIDNQGQIITTNPAASEILEYMSEALQANLLQELPPLEIFGDDSATTSQTSLPQTEPKHYRVGNCVYSALDAPMLTPSGESLGTVIVFRDITRKAEAEHLQEGFITSVSHELRTPLTAIKGYSDILLKISKSELDNTHLNFIEKINSNTDRLIHHTNKLIDISEIQAGTLAIRKEPLQLSSLVQEIAAKWQPEIENRNLTLETHFPDKEALIMGDRERLGMAVENLLDNAYNYTPNGSITLNLFLENNEVRLDIIDTGIGIAAIDQSYIFSRFFRAHNNNEFTFNVDGVGLGLYIAKAIIELHGGRIWFASNINTGSTFSFALPRVPDTR